MVERIRMVKERIKRARRIHWRGRLVDVSFFLRIGFGGS